MLAAVHYLLARDAGDPPASYYPSLVFAPATGDPAELGPWLASHMDVNARTLPTSCRRGLVRMIPQVKAAGQNRNRVLKPHTLTW